MYYFLLFGQTFSIIVSAGRVVRYGASYQRAELSMGRVVRLSSQITMIVIGSWIWRPIKLDGQLIMIKLIVITGGVQKGPKDASAFAFPTLNSWKTISKQINDGAGAPPPPTLNPPLRPKQAFLESLYLWYNLNP